MREQAGRSRWRSSPSGAANRSPCATSEPAAQSPLRGSLDALWRSTGRERRYFRPDRSTARKRCPANFESNKTISSEFYFSAPLCPPFPTLKPSINELVLHRPTIEMIDEEPCHLLRYGMASQRHVYLFGSSPQKRERLLCPELSTCQGDCPVRSSENPMVLSEDLTIISLRF
jgi:hypothetical protein